MQMLSSYIPLIFYICFSLVSAAAAPKGSVSMRILNLAGSPIELFWINTFQPQVDYVKQTTKPIRNNTDTVINSYNTHQFQVRFVNEKFGKSVDFTKGPKEETVTVKFDRETKSLTVKQSTKYDEVKETIHSATSKSCLHLKGEGFAACVADSVITEISRVSDSRDNFKKYHGILSDRLRNYSCADETLETSPSINSYRIQLGDQPYDINVLLDETSAKIWYVDNLVTKEECDILERVGRPTLRRATVAAEDGTSVVSEHRKAQQTSYAFAPDRDSDPLWPLYNKIFAITNSHAGFELTPDGQEEFTIIQYNVDDQYTPHCDGDCDGLPHTSKGRVATAVLYCKTADKGGATTFTKADLFVKPKPGTVTFFSYKGKNGLMDEGFTEHSGCPVLEGEKFITTVWMREGVSAKEPWELFDPTGIRILSEEDYAETSEENSEAEL